MKSFIREFEVKCQIVDADATGYLNYAMFVALFRLLGLYNQTSKPPNCEVILLLNIWEDLGGDRGSLDLMSIKALAMAVMGYHQLWMDQFGFQVDKVSRVHDECRVLLKHRG